MNAFGLFAFAAALLAASATAAQEPRSTAPVAGANQLDRRDRDFLQRMAQAALFERRASEFALQRGEDHRVTDFAQKLVADTTMIEPALRQMAKKLGASLPGGLSAQDQGRFNRFQKLNGKQFDNAYVQDIRAVTQDVVGAMQQEAQATQSDVIKAFIEHVGPMQTSLMQQAQKLPMKGSG